ncbi:hypothetical protein WJX72_008533 [[Myrmecia] bisecta]|uniref:Fcf2 pre-rRNA processing C-terminal domain-containing protein n=1 Tax=[Myrmecia] bisecta TaxID=41462 RepID=A0AAW1PDA7_9CHLO
MRGEEEAGPSSHPADEDDVKEMHWEPETGLPAALMADEDASRKVPKLQAGAGDAERPGLPNRAAQRAARKAAPETAGRDWFDLPATPITDDMKRDLRLLRLRGAYDTKRFYKSADQTKFPKYFAMGTVVETPADYYSGRLTNAERKRTLAEELLGDEQLTQMRKKRYNRVQAEKEHWAQKKGRKTDKPRIKKKPHRPKH